MSRPKEPEYPVQKIRMYTHKVDMYPRGSLYGVIMMWIYIANNGKFNAVPNPHADSSPPPQ